MIIIWTGELPIECIGLFQNPASYFGGLKLVALNSMMNSPIFYHRLAQFGIENFIRQLDHPAVLLITRDFTMNCIEDYLIDKHSIRPIFEPQMESNALGIRAYKVVFTDDPNRPDTDLSRLCPVPRSEDVIIFPVQADSGYTCRFMDCESISEKGEKTDFRITGRHPRISIKLDRKPQSLEEVSHLFVELAVADSIKNNRMLCLWVKVNKQRGQLCFTRLLKDAKLHRYAYDLRRLPFGKNDRITHININPLFQRTLFDGEQFRLGRAGFIKKSSSNPPTASSTAE